MIFVGSRQTRAICLTASLYEEYGEKLKSASGELGLAIISEGELKAGKYQVVANISETFERSGDLSYLVASEVFLPVMDGEGIKLMRESELADGQLAVAVNGLYAWQEKYPLKENHYASCTVLEENFREKVAQVCEQVFGGCEPSLDGAMIGAVGDLMLMRGIEDILIGEADGVERVFNDTLPFLQNDLMIGNLEGAVTRRNEAWNKTYVFKFDERALPALKQAGFDYLGVANNHCYDYGEAGFKDTLDALKRYDVATSGGGLNKTEAEQFYRFQINGRTYSVLSCGAFPVERSGFNGKTMATATENRAGILWYSEEVLELVKQEKALGHFVVMAMHAGIEYDRSPSNEQRRMYRALCDAGADIVFGSHPHVIQAVEYYGSSLIVYSLGNFLFNGMDGYPGATDTEVVRVGVLNGKIRYVEIQEVKIHGASVRCRK